MANKGSDEAVDSPMNCSGILIIGYIKFVLEGGFGSGDAERERETQKC